MYFLSKSLLHTQYDTVHNITTSLREIGTEDVDWIQQVNERVQR
jgi:hypothetical protein